MATSATTAPEDVPLAPPGGGRVASDRLSPPLQGAGPQAPGTLQ
jgi:hypothetical protein